MLYQLAGPQFAHNAVFHKVGKQVIHVWSTIILIFRRKFSSKFKPFYFLITAYLGSIRGSTSATLTTTTVPTSSSSSYTSATDSTPSYRSSYRSKYLRDDDTAETNNTGWYKSKCKHVPGSTIKQKIMVN